MNTDGPDVTLYCHPLDTARATVAAVRAYGDDTTWEVVASQTVPPGRLVVVSQATIRDLLGDTVSQPVTALAPGPVGSLCGHAGCPAAGPCAVEQMAASTFPPAPRILGGMTS